LVYASVLAGDENVLLRVKLTSDLEIVIPGGDPESMPRFMDSRVRGNDEGVGGGLVGFVFL